MKIGWIAPAYSPTKIQSLRSCLAERQRVQIDRMASLQINLAIGHYDECVDTSGLATFYKAMQGFLSALEIGSRANLIIDDDDAFHILCEPEGNIYRCSLRCGGRELAYEEGLAYDLTKITRNYLSLHETYLHGAGLYAVVDL